MDASKNKSHERGRGRQSRLFTTNESKSNENKVEETLEDSPRERMMGRGVGVLLPLDISDISDISEILDFRIKDI